MSDRLIDGSVKQFREDEMRVWEITALDKQLIILSTPLYGYRLETS